MAGEPLDDTEIMQQLKLARKSPFTTSLLKIHRNHLKDDIKLDENTFSRVHKNIKLYENRMFILQKMVEDKYKNARDKPKMYRHIYRCIYNIVKFLHDPEHPITTGMKLAQPVYYLTNDKWMVLVKFVVINHVGSCFGEIGFLIKLAACAIS